MRYSWNFFTSDQLIFGSGSIEQLGDLATARDLKRVLIVTDPALVNAGIVQQVRQPLDAAAITVGIFDAGEPEPSLQTADAAIEFARDFAPDAILGLGGGSNMDLAKIVAIVITHGRTPADYFSWDNVPGPIMPLICVPTTAGTGSEVSHAAVLTDTANEIKVSTLSNYLRPALAIVDPKLALTCPPQATADSGIDALTHAVEAYTAVDFDQLDVPPEQTSPYAGRHPLGDCLAEKAIGLVGTHLVHAVQDGSNLEAREGMALASTLAGMSFSNCGVAVVHALEYPLGGALHCSHGAGNGMLLPYVMRFNLPERTEAIARIGQLLGVDTSGMDTQQAAEAAISAVEQLKKAINIPDRIRDIGGSEEQLPGFAAKSYAIERLMLLNPRRPSEEDLLGILKDAF